MLLLATTGGSAFPVIHAGILPPRRAPLLPVVPSEPSDPVRRPGFHDCSRTGFESRLAFAGADEGDGENAEELATPARRFTLFEIPSGLPDDSREADERDRERHLRDLRGRVKAARAAISTTPEAEEVLQRDWVKAARFYARFGITEGMFRLGVPRSENLSEVNLLLALTGASIVITTESRVRGDATLPAFPTR